MTIPITPFGQATSWSNQNHQKSTVIHAPNEFMDNLDKHDYKFFGLAKFYNKKNFYIYGQNGLGFEPDMNVLNDYRV